MTDAPRRATEADLGSIAELDAACFGNPWSQEIYRQELFRPFGRLYVLEHEGAIEGWICLWIVADEAHLLRVAAEPSRRRRGIGRRLLRWSLGHVVAAGCRAMILEVAASNRPARALYEAFDFEVIGRRRAYYKAPPDDAVVMRRTLEPGPT